MTILSIPNNVIGPVLRGLCSSHSAIVRRISNLLHDLSNTIIDYDPKGPLLPHLKAKALITYCTGLGGLAAESIEAKLNAKEHAFTS